MFKIINYSLIALFAVFISCQSDVEDNQTDISEDFVQNQVDTSNIEEIPLILEDSINGQPNDKVFQRADGLRIEWKVKKTDQPVQENDVIMVNYTARVAAGEKFDSNKELGKPVPLKMNVGMMLRGWEEAMLLMHVGDKGRIMIPSDLAYGEDGYLTVVPPDADIIVDIELVSKVEPILLEDGVKVYKWNTVIDGAQPTKNQLITFDYFAYRKGKKPGMYDNSYKNENPFSFKFHNDNVIDGLHIGMGVMKPGESAFIEVPTAAAYGSKGLADLVPKNTDIVYDVRVLTIQ